MNNANNFATNLIIAEDGMGILRQDYVIYSMN